jgi:hypothetical protein
MPGNYHSLQPSPLSTFRSLTGFYPLFCINKLETCQGGEILVTLTESLDHNNTILELIDGWLI